MTEEEAKTKWCPMTGAVAPNDLKKRTCEGSGCMAWRWSNANRHMVIAEDLGAIIEPLRPANVPASYTWVPHDPDEGEPAGWLEPRHGYCGLAGTTT